MSGLGLWIASLGVTLAMLLGVSRAANAALEDARAATAADAAALAGAAAGPNAAAQAASRNGALVRSITQSGPVITVTVTIGDAHATAHAERILIPID